MSLPRGYTDDDIEFVRARAPTMSDAEIAKELGWAGHKVLRLRHQHKIAPRDDWNFWTEEMVEKARQMYIVQGLTSTEVGKALGCGQGAVRRKAYRLKWIRDPAFRAKNQYRAQATRAAERPAPTPKPRVPPKPKPDYSLARYDFSRAQPRFINAPRQEAPIGERIIAELTRRPLTTMTLSTVLGEKEAIVGQALSVLRYEAKVASEAGANVRQTIWSVAA